MPSIWTLEGSLARYDDGRLQGRVDLLRPELGLHDLRIGGAPANESCRLLGVELGPISDDAISLPESYARVDDLVATYPQTAARPFRVQAYWRRVDDAPLAGCRDAIVIELQVSINTSLLDTQPAVVVASNIAINASQIAGEVVAGLTASSTSDSADGVKVRGLSGELTFWEATHPSDRARTHVKHHNEAIEISRRLFGGFLEKGVIMRARIRAAIVPSAAADTAIESIRTDFAAAPLPLTT